MVSISIDCHLAKAIRKKKPVVTYACETWTLKETITNRLMVFERKVLRKIYGPTKENVIW